MEWSGPNDEQQWHQVSSPLTDRPSNPSNNRVAGQDDVDKISSIRSAIDAKLHEDGIYQQIRDLIASKAAPNNQAPSAVIATEGGGGNEEEATVTAEKNEDSLIREVLQSELVQQLLTAIKQDRELKKLEGDDTCEEAEERQQDQQPRPSLYIRMAGGRAFLDQLTQEDEAENTSDDGIAKITENQIGLVRGFFRITVIFQGQRMSCRDVPCSVDPPFDEHFRLPITKRTTRTGRTKSGGLYEINVVAPWEALCLVDEPLQIVLLKVTKKLVSFQHSTGPIWHELRRELVASHRLDWRRVLCSTLQLVHMPIQLIDAMKVPVGSLDLRLDVLQFSRSMGIAKEVTTFLNKEAMEKNTLHHSFYRYAKEWWQEYRGEMDSLDANNNHGRHTHDLSSPASMGEAGMERALLRSTPRLVKLFAEDDDARFRMVCKFVSPLRSPLAVRSPCEAARFVALLPHSTIAMLGGVASDAWQSISTTLAVGKGDTQDHAVLLASLLLGCGLDAYVCIGTVSSKKQIVPQRRRERLGGRSHSSASEVGHLWVMTRDPDRPNDAEGVLFWESLTGERYSVRDHKSAANTNTNSNSAARHGYVTIDCIFNGTHFYANLQPRHWKISDYSLALDDDTAWKPLDASRIAALPSTVSCCGSLTPPDFTAAAAQEQQWTASLKRAITSQRRGNGLVTKWNGELAFYLQPALNSYEMERLYHVPQLENDLFQQTIKNFVKEGCTFQAVPIMFKTPPHCGSDEMETITQNKMASKILSIQGRGAQFACAVRCFAYAEGLFVVWVMLAVSYQS